MSTSARLAANSTEVIEEYKKNRYKSDLKDVPMEWFREIYSNISLTQRYDQFDLFVTTHYRNYNESKKGMRICYLPMTREKTLPKNRRFSWRVAELRKNFRSSQNLNQYLSINGFRGYSRKTEDCFQINGAFLDLDAHGVSDEVLARKIARTLCVLHARIADATIPQPTMMVYTGRGLQIYYDYAQTISYRRKDKHLNFLVQFHQEVQEGLLKLYHKVLDAECLAVDFGCKDIARVARVPGSCNQAVNKIARLIGGIGPYHDLNQLRDVFLLEVLQEDEGILANAPVKEPQKELPIQNVETVGAPVPSAVFAGDSERMMAVLKARLNGIVNLQTVMKQNNVRIGFRHDLLFHYYNIVRQLYKDDLKTAHKLALDFNKQFLIPLSEGHVYGVFGSFKDPEGYKFRNDTFHEWKQRITEMVGCGWQDFFSYRVKSNSGREYARFLKREAKNRKKAEAVSLYNEGKLSIKAIAEKLGVHRNTIHRWLAAAETTQEAPQITSVAPTSESVENAPADSSCSSFQNTSGSVSREDGNISNDTMWVIDLSLLSRVVDEMIQGMEEVEEVEEDDGYYIYKERPVRGTPKNFAGRGSEANKKGGKTSENADKKGGKTSENGCTKNANKNVDNVSFGGRAQ